MTTVGHGLDHLSPAEKRARLAVLLEQRARQAVAAKPAASMPEQGALLDHFGAPVAQLRGDVTLDRSICGDGLPPASATPQQVLLTGATGFLGAFLLHELLQHTDATIYCLVRCASAAAGLQRIRRNYANYLGAELPAQTRVVAVAGDLAQPLLGLSERAFEQLGATVDRIYHNGALVEWLSPYEHLKDANVAGTREIFRLATTGTLKQVHYVSSLSVFPIVGDLSGTTIHEDDPLDHGGVLHGGYTQSKWVGEMIAQLARARGVPVCVYRPGLITGHSQSGAASIDDFICKLIKSWVELGLAPALTTPFDITPVDYVSRAIVGLSLRPESLGDTYHLVNPVPITMQAFIELIRGLGYPIASIPYADWRARMMEQSERSWESAAYALLPLFYFSASETETTLPRFDCRRTLAALPDGLVCPSSDAALVATYFRYFSQVAFIDPPGVRTVAREVAGERAVCATAK